QPTKTCAREAGTWKDPARAGQRCRTADRIGPQEKDPSAACFLQRVERNSGETRSCEFAYRGFGRQLKKINRGYFQFTGGLFRSTQLGRWIRSDRHLAQGFRATGGLRA